MNSVVTVFCAGLILVGQCFGQDASVAGRVVRKGRQPMVFAHVTYTHLPTGRVYATQADAEGRYGLSGLTLSVSEQPAPHREPFQFLVTNTVGSSRNFVLQTTFRVDKVLVFDILGRRVAEVPLVTDQRAGNHWIGTGYWDGHSANGTLVADGVYFAAVVAPSGLRTVKFVQLASGPAALPQRVAQLSVPDLPERRGPRWSLDDSPYTVTLSRDPAAGGRFADTSFTRLLHEGDNGEFADTVSSLPAERVLFVGNSYTYYNGGVDVHVRNLALSADSTSHLQTSSITGGGYTLEMHWNTSGTRDSIRLGRWDLVILQEQSTRPVEEPELMYQYAARLDSVIIGSGAETGFYMTWGRQNRPFMIDSLAAAYEHIGTQLQATIAPVGRAWQQCIEQNPTLNLYDTDGSHPNVYGTYLTCCVFYATIWGRSPVGIRYVNDPQISETDRTFLQTVAWETVRNYHPL